MCRRPFPKYTRPCASRTCAGDRSVPSKLTHRCEDNQPSRFSLGFNGKRKKAYHKQGVSVSAVVRGQLAQERRNASVVGSCISLRKPQDALPPCNPTPAARRLGGRPPQRRFQRTCTDDSHREDCVKRSAGVRVVREFAKQVYQKGLGVAGMLKRHSQRHGALLRSVCVL